MAVGIEGKFTLQAHQDFAVAAYRGHVGLFENTDSIFVEVKVVVHFEESVRLQVVSVGSHDQPRNVHTVLAAQGQNFFCMNVEQGPVANRTYNELALGPVESKAGSLSSSDEKTCHTSFSKRFLADGTSFIGCLLLRLVGRNRYYIRGLKIIEVRRVRSAFDEFVNQFFNNVEFQCGYLRNKLRFVAD